MATTPTKVTYRFQNADAETRLQELILYVAEKCQGDPKFGATKLNKILWWSDFLAYGQRGKPITGVEYMRLPQGPVPKHYLPVAQRLQAEGAFNIAIVTTRGGYQQKRPVALRPANLGVFSPEDISLVDHVINALRNKTAKGVSTQSHGKAWEVASDKESIPYEAVFLSDDRVTREDITRTKALGRTLGWQFA
jgi:hypothetical protein